MNTVSNMGKWLREIEGGTWGPAGGWGQEKPGMLRRGS